MKEAEDIESIEALFPGEMTPQPAPGKDDYLIVKQHNIQKNGIEGRRFRRFNMRLMGRFMTQDRSEYTCRVMNISAGGAAISSNVHPQMGEEIILYIDHIGRAKGRVGRSEPDHFAVCFEVSDAQKERVGLKISWLVNQIDSDELNLRRHHRFIANKKEITLHLASKISVKCKVQNYSLSGVAVETTARPDLGTHVTLGHIKAIVMRYYDDGLGLEFVSPLSAAKLLTEFGLVSSQPVLSD